MRNSAPRKRNGPAKTATGGGGTATLGLMPNERSIEELERRNSSRMKVGCFSFSFCVLVGMVLITVFYVTNNSSSQNSQNSRKKEIWNKDDDFFVSSKSNDINCDFPIIHAKAFEKKKNRNIDGLLDQPFIIRGMITKWPAQENWQKHNFTQLYENKTVNSGSESSIVYGGGSAGLKSNVRNILQDMNRCSEEHSAEHFKNNENNGTDEKTEKTVRKYGGSCDSFIFDVSVLKSIPELGRDFRVPGLFRHWDNPEKNKQGVTWHMLSLGASRTGLPFHSHGATWLGLVFGMKRWFIYPPGAAPPISMERAHNPLRTVYDWFIEIYPQMEGLEQPPINGDLPVRQGGSPGYRPLECVQMPGDIMYVPAGWSHLTLNIGEAIGVGGQTAMPASDRLSSSLEILKGSPLNFDALKGVGLSLTLLAIEEETKVLRGFLHTAKGMIQLKGSNFEPVVLQGEDTWIIKFFLSGPGTEDSRNSSIFWNNLAARLEGVASVGSFDLGSDRGERGDRVKDDDAQMSVLKQLGISIERLRFGPLIRVYPGRPIIAEYEMDKESHSETKTGKVGTKGEAEVSVNGDSDDIDKNDIDGDRDGDGIDGDDNDSYSTTNQNQNEGESYGDSKVAEWYRERDGAAGGYIEYGGAVDLEEILEFMGDTMGIISPHLHPAPIHDSAPDINDPLQEHTQDTPEFTAEAVRRLQTAHSSTRSMKKALNDAVILDTEIKTKTKTTAQTNTGKDKGEHAVVSNLGSKKKSGENSGNVLLERGSAAAIGAKARRMFLEAEHLFRKCLSVQPLHPEAHGLLGEVLGHMGDRDGMRKHITYAASMYGQLDNSRVSVRSLASVYHRLATSYLTTRELGIEALPLLEKSLSISPSYIPALADKAVAFYLAHDFDRAEVALQELELIAPGHEVLSSIREAIQLDSDKNQGSAAKKRGSGGSGGSGGRRSVHGDRAGEDIKKNNRILKKKETQRF